MKKSVGKIFIFSSLALVSLISCNPDNNSTSSNIKIYVCDDYGSVYDTRKTIDVRFYSISNLPYVSVKDYLNTFVPNTYNISYSNNVFKFTNKIWANKSSKITFKPNAYFNVNSKTMTYDDYPCFVNINEDAYHPLDLVAGKNLYLEGSSGKKYYIFPEIPDYSYVAGDSVSIDLNTYNLDVRVENGNLYMPIYTIKSLFTSNYVESFFYNGKALYECVPNYNEYSSYISSIKSNLFSPNSDYLKYSYNQLALDLDLHFGMGGFTRQMRHNSSPYTYQTGIGGTSYNILNNYKSTFLSSVNGFEDAAIKLFSEKLDDGGHTGILGKSYFQNPGKIDRGDEFKYANESYNNIFSTRKDKGDGSYDKYFSATDKFVLRFDDFDSEGFNLVRDFGNTLTYYEPSYNTKVVIDLSCNGGGYVFLQHYLNQYLSRGNCKNAVKHSINGSYGYVSYPADFDLDGVVDEYDYLPIGSTVDIICSNETFSAANATACYAKKYENKSQSTINIIGEQSGGGVCAVDSTMATPFGMTMQFSSPYRLTYEDYSYVDDGVKPLDGSSNKWNSHSTSSAINFSQYYIGKDL